MNIIILIDLDSDSIEPEKEPDSTVSFTQSRTKGLDCRATIAHKRNQAEESRDTTKGLLKGNFKATQ